MDFNKDWKSSLEKLPDWALLAVTLLKEQYDYIAYRLIEGIDDFLQISKIEIENGLPGSRDLNSNMHLTAFQQRAAFFVMAIRHADYFRPISAKYEKKIPAIFQPGLRPSAVDDLAFQLESRIEIGQLAKSIASLLKRHSQATQRLGVRHFECDPLDLIKRYSKSSNGEKFQDGVGIKFNQLRMRKVFLQDQTNFLAGVMDELCILANEPDRSLIPAELELGITSRKSDHHFYSAFNNWLGENYEEYGGFIPNKFHLTDRCWATLVTSLTYKDVDEKSIQMARSRAVEHQEEAFSRTPQFDFDKLFESWEQKNS